MMATYFVAELILSPASGSSPTASGAHRVMQLGPVFGASRWSLTFADHRPLPARRDALHRGRGGRRQHPVAPGLHRHRHQPQPAAARPVGGPLRGGHPGGLGIGSVAAGFLYEVFGPDRVLLNAGIYGITLRSSTAGASRTCRARARRAGRGARARPPCSTSGAIATCCAAGRCGSWRRPGSRSTRSSARGARSPSSSSSRSRRPSSPTSS